MEDLKLKGRPLHERVIVEVTQPNERTESGLYIPQEALDAPTTGIVKAIGNLVNKEGEMLKVGDRVLFIKHSGFPVEVDGHQYQMILCNDIIFVYED